MNPKRGNREGLTRRRSEERNVQNSHGWAVATPLWTAFQPPNAFGTGGRYRPNLSSRFPRSVAGRVVGEAVKKSESHQPEENNTWH